MNIKTAEYLTSAVKPSQYPAPPMPEFGFAGRSNVGKSSLINALVNRKNLVKTSATPGKTRTVNFFKINNEFMFVDLPGYGYAKVPQAVKDQWGPMIETYLKTRKNLSTMFLILDIRRTPEKKELAFIDWLNKYQIPFQIILTKSDKLSRNQQIKQHNLISGKLSLSKELMILFSAKTKLGVDQTWKIIEKSLEKKVEQVEPV